MVELQWVAAQPLPLRCNEHGDCNNSDVQEVRKLDKEDSMLRDVHKPHNSPEDSGAIGAAAGTVVMPLGLFQDLTEVDCSIPLVFGNRSKRIHRGMPKDDQELGIAGANKDSHTELGGLLQALVLEPIAMR